MVRKIVRWSLAFSLCVLGIAHAADGVPPGRYVSQGDWGTLEVKKSGAITEFQIDAMGGNCHICSLGGIIKGNTGVVDDGGLQKESERCKVSFKAEAGGFLVEPLTEEPCRTYCGARASFDGVYKIPPAACHPKQQKARRGEFLKLYKAKKYSEAQAVLSSLLVECSDFINWVDIDRVRNDLALAQYHGGDAAACLNTLETTRAGKEKEGDFWLPPCDHDNYIAVAKSTWHNQKLCRKTLGR